MMQQKVVVTRIYGDQTMGAAIAGAFESPELKKLQAKIGVSAPVREAHYLKKIQEADFKYNYKYKSEIPSARKQKLWGLIGLATLLFVHPQEGIWNA